MISPTKKTEANEPEDMSLQFPFPDILTYANFMKPITERVY